MNKLITALMLLISASNSFAYVYADESDPLSARMQQQDNEDRLSSLESKQQSNDLERFEQELYDNMGDL